MALECSDSGDSEMSQASRKGVPGSLAPRTMAARRARITALLSTTIIGSQDELRVALAEEGIMVTQTTLSRDLDGLGARRVADENGSVQYLLPDSGNQPLNSDSGRDALSRIVADVLIGVEAAMNIAVLHTPPGAAHYLAGTLDRSGLRGMVGSVAGDDTVLVVMRTAEDAAVFCSDLLRLADRTRTTKNSPTNLKHPAVDTRQRRIS